MPLCETGGHAPATWRTYLLVRVVGKEEPHLVPAEYVCNTHRKVKETIAQAAPQAFRALLLQRFRDGGYPDPDWARCSVTFEPA